MNKSEIERIALEVAADIPVLGSPVLKHYIGKYEAIQLCSRFLAAIDAERGKDAVAWFTDDYACDKSATTYHAIIAERWKEKGWPVTPLFLSAPTIPEGMCLVPIEPTKAMLIEGRQADTDWMNSDDPEEEFEQGLAYIYKEMLAAAQGEK